MFAVLPFRLPVLFLAAFLAQARGAETSRVDPSTLTGKVMVGYQGWFNAEGDGAKRGYNHWTRGGVKPAPGNVRVDMWPDLSEFPAAERFPTDLVHADGTRAEVFSSYLRPTVGRHFAWMQEHGIDGVFLQRFINSLARGNSLAANAFSAVAGAAMYFATLTEVPILQGLIGSGMGQGPALALLLAGPALSLPSMIVIHSILGLKKTAAYIGLVVVLSTLVGWGYGAWAG